MAVGEPPAGGSHRESWGVLGGTFDPIHYAHLAIAEAARERLGLDGILFVPAGVPPHKPERPITSAPARSAMVELAIADNPRFRLSRIELDRAGPSYTVDTIAELRRARPGDELTLILSAEALGGFLTWRDPERLVALCRIAVLPRAGYRIPGRAWVAEHFPGAEERFVFLDGPELSYSASYIRAEAAAGRSIRYLVPPAVDDYIREHDLYPALREARSR